MTKREYGEGSKSAREKNFERGVKRHFSFRDVFFEYFG